MKVSTIHECAMRWNSIVFLCTCVGGVQCSVVQLMLSLNPLALNSNYSLPHSFAWQELSANAEIHYPPIIYLVVLYSLSVNHHRLSVLWLIVMYQ